MPSSSIPDWDKRFDRIVVVGDPTWTASKTWANEEFRGGTTGGTIFGEFIQEYADVPYEDLEGLDEIYEGEASSILKKSERGRRTTLAKFPGIEMDEEDPGPPSYVFHMTPTKNVASILKQGLVPRSGGSFTLLEKPIKGVYTARYPDDITAMAVFQYLESLDAGSRIKSSIDPKQTILRIKVRPGMRFKEDPGFDYGAPMYIFLDKVPARDIEVVDTIDLGSF